MGTPPEANWIEETALIEILENRKVAMAGFEEKIMTAINSPYNRSSGQLHQGRFTLEEVMSQQFQIFQNLGTELKKALMHKLFTEGLRGEPKNRRRLGFYRRVGRSLDSTNFVYSSVDSTLLKNRKGLEMFRSYHLVA